MFGHEPQILRATSARKQVGIKVSKGEKGKEKSFDFVVANEPTFRSRIYKEWKCKTRYHG